MALTVQRPRKSRFVKRFTKTPRGVVCPHFYELILSNGCPYDCTYCYLRLTFRGRTSPTLFTNNWKSVEKQLEASGPGVYNTGELADSLAVCPPLLETAIEFFASQQEKYLLLVTKSTNVGALVRHKPSPQVIVSFSLNAHSASQQFERGAPPPDERLEVARDLMAMGWRVRLRIDPIISQIGINSYRDLCTAVRKAEAERVTVGTLRQYPGVHSFSKGAPREGLSRAWDGRMRYSVQDRVSIYSQVADWLGFEPALCKETEEVWDTLGWDFQGCNCTE